MKLIDIDRNIEARYNYIGNCCGSYWGNGIASKRNFVVKTETTKIFKEEYGYKCSVLEIDPNLFLHIYERVE